MTLINNIKGILKTKNLDEETIYSVLNAVGKIINQNTEYGLLWEPQSEDLMDELLKTYPYFKRIGEINNDSKNNNILIKGDNLYALMGMQNIYMDKRTGKGLIDIIYIDPPYNTENKDFVYNDKFIGDDDQYKHSKWLSFMNKRLLLAKNIMKDDGVIFISIDDHEQAQLKLLCDKIFGEDNMVGMYMWYKSATPPNLSKKIRKNLEYILCYQKKKDNGKFIGISNKSKSLDPTTKPKNAQKEWTFYPGQLVVKKEDGIIKAGTYGTEKYPNELYNDMIVENNTNKNEVTFSNRFIWTQDTLQENLNSKEDNGVVMVASKDLVLSYKRNNYEDVAPNNLIDAKNGVSTTEEAGKELNKMFDGEEVFSYPKPTSLIKYLIRICDKKDPLVLDFFAGSGTTGQAVLEFNEENESNARFILVTNNEIDNQKDLDYLIEHKYINNPPKNAKKNSKVYKEWENEVKEFKNSNEYYELQKTNDYQSIGIFESVTRKRLNKLIDENDNSWDKKYLDANLYVYETKNDIKKTPFKELNVENVIDKFVEFIAIKENCFNKEIKDNFVRYTNEKELLIFTNPCLLKKKIVKTAEKEFSDCNKEKIVYANISDEFMNNDIFYKPYPTEILNHLSCVEMEVKD